MRPATLQRLARVILAGVLLALVAPASHAKPQQAQEQASQPHKGKATGKKAKRSPCVRRQPYRFAPDSAAGQVVGWLRQHLNTRKTPTH